MESHTLCETDLYLESEAGHMTCPGCHGNQHSSRLAVSGSTWLLGTGRPPWVALWASLPLQPSQPGRGHSSSLGTVPVSGHLL